MPDGKKPVPTGPNKPQQQQAAKPGAVSSAHYHGHDKSPKLKPSAPATTGLVGPKTSAGGRRLASKESDALGQIQREELEALSSIFGTDLRMDKPIWGNASFSILIRLLGQDSLGASLAHASVELAITYTAKYPQTAPTIEVRRPKDQIQSPFAVTDEELKIIRAKVVAEAEKWAHEKQGDPFLFELIRLVQDYLAERSKLLRAPGASVAEQRATESHPQVQSTLVREDSASLQQLEEEARAKKREAWRQEQQQQGTSERKEPPSGVPGVEKAVGSKNEHGPVSSLNPVVLQPGKRGGRYATDFEDLGAVGRGGFGHVYKARNRLDGMIYAVKKIRLESDEAANRKTRNEATTLAKLVHPNIVRYFAAWLEEDDGEGDSEDEDESDEDEEFSESEPSILRPASSFTGFMSQDDDDDQFGFEWDDQDDDEDDDETSSGYGTSGTKEPKQSGKRGVVTTGTAIGAAGLNLGAGSKSGRRRLSAGGSRGTPGARLRKQTLYIVMEFVPRTIRSLIDSRELLDKETRCYELIREILEALSCVHELGIIHQDIKPENLLIDAQGRVKLGDFGLAVDLLEGEGRDGTEVGTTYYRAPEVGKGRWDEKCDIFSLGVVVIEIFSPPTDTGMERHKLLTNLRLEPPLLPPNLTEEPAQLARRMLQKDPLNRPSAAEALKVIPGHVLVEHAVDTVVKTLAPASNAYNRLLKHLFSQFPSKEVDVTFDYDPGAAEAAAKEEHENALRFSSRAYSELSALGALPIAESLVPVNREVVSGILEQAASKALELIGCSRFRAPLLTPLRSDDTGSDQRKRVVTLMDSSGVCVSLPYATLTRNFCRFVSLNREIRFLKRYEAGLTYSRAGGGGQPNAHKQLCVDVAASLKDLKEDGMRTAVVELLETIRDVICVQTRLVTAAGTGFTLEIGHAKLLPALFDLAKVPSESRGVLLQAIKSKEFFRDWKQVQDVLVSEAKCPIRAVQALKFCIPIGKRMWISGTNGEITPSTTVSPLLKTRLATLMSHHHDLGEHESTTGGGGAFLLGSDGGGGGGAGASGSSALSGGDADFTFVPQAHHHHPRSSSHPRAMSNLSSSLSTTSATVAAAAAGGQSGGGGGGDHHHSSSTSSSGGQGSNKSLNVKPTVPHPLDVLYDHILSSFPAKTNDAVLNILGEMILFVHALQPSTFPRIRVVLWTDAPQDVTGLFVRCVIRQRRAIVKTNNAGKTTMTVEEGPEFVCADGGRVDDLYRMYSTKSSSSNNDELMAGATLRLYLDRIAKLRAYFSLETMLKRPLVRFCCPIDKDSSPRFDCEERAKAAARLRAELPGISAEWAHPVGLSGDALLALCRDAGARVMISRVASASSSISSTSSSLLSLGASSGGGGAGTTGTSANVLHPSASSLSSSLMISSSSQLLSGSGSTGGGSSKDPSSSPSLTMMMPPPVEMYRVRGWAFPASADLNAMQHSNSASAEAQLHHVGIFIDKRCDSWSEMIKTVAQMLAYSKIFGQAATGGSGVGGAPLTAPLTMASSAILGQTSTSGAATSSRLETF